MADIFDVVADPTRRDVLHVLLEAYVGTDSERGEISVGEMVERLAISQPTVSKHLKVLRDHGLVRVREEGQHRYYSLDAGPLEELEDWLIPFLSADFEAGGADEYRDSSAAFAAWSGADVGESIGRTVAERSYRARTVLHDASEMVSALPKKFRRRLFHKP
jgi:DNA-binding transcriptional ArsR family regulator